MNELKNIIKCENKTCYNSAECLHKGLDMYLCWDCALKFNKGKNFVHIS